MGLILNTSVVIAVERMGGTVNDLLRRAATLDGDIELGLSAISVVELTHGIHSANSPEGRERRLIFTRKAFHDLMVHPLTLEIAQLAGRIEGEQAAVGNRIAFEDLVIGATALHLNFAVATLNLRHFQRIPNLQIATF